MVTNPEKVQQDSLLGPLLFLVYINDLRDNLQSLAKLFTDDTSLFSTVNSHLLPAEITNNDLIKISTQPYHWKMPFLNRDSLHARLNSHYEA